MRNGSKLIGNVFILVVIGICVFALKGSILSVINPKPVVSLKEIENFLETDAQLPSYATLEEPYLLDSGWYITDASDKKETEIYIGHNGDKYFLVGLSSTKEINEDFIEEDKLLVSNYNTDEVKDFYSIKSGIAQDLTDAFEETVNPDEIMDGMFLIEKDTKKGMLIYTVGLIIAIVVAVSVVKEIVHR